MASRPPADAMRALDDLAQRYDLTPDAASRFAALLGALAAEPDPHTGFPIEDAIDLHIADSLSGLDVADLRSASRLADVGSGAGFPGLPLAIALPAARVDLIESASRKAAVMERLAAAAKVANARVLAARVEEVASGDGRGAYDAVTARAVGALAVLVEYAAPLLAPGGVLVAWKGERQGGEEESGGAAAEQVGLTVTAILPVRPYEASRNRHLHVYTKTGPTPDRLPRRPGMAAKRPLA